MMIELMESFKCYLTEMQMIILQFTVTPDANRVKDSLHKT